MNKFSEDIYTEPETTTNTLANLGPLRPMASTWSGAFGQDVAPKADGPDVNGFVEHYDLQPIDAQTNWPQLLYGLRYHTHIHKPNDPETFHDQVGYWLWEPATRAITLTLAIPRGQVAMYSGTADADAREFTVQARRGSLTNGIVSGAFLEHAFRTETCTMSVTIHDDGTWSYKHDTELIIPGQARPFHHTDSNTLHKIGEPEPNPTARK